MNETLLYGGFQYVMKASGEILTTTDDSEMGYFVDVDLELRDTLEKKARYVPLCPESTKFDKQFFTGLM